MTKAGTDFRNEVFDLIDADRELLAETCLELGNTYGPCGHEQPVADAVSAWYERHGIAARQQQILPDRSNVVATLPSSRTGASSLIFNAHLDTEISGPDHANLMESSDPNLVGAWREGDRIFGHTVLNDRGCMSVFMVMAKALQEAGSHLGGDVILTSVVGETGMAPVDEYQGLSYEGKGFGTRHLVDHGVRADYALVAETTAWSMSWIECGAVYLKVTLRGRNMYTPRLIRQPDLVDHPNAIVKGAAVATALEAWCIDYEERNSYVSALGEVRPKAQVGAIRGGVPYRPNRSSPVCKLYMDVRTPPGADQDAVIDEVRAVARSVDPRAEVECYTAKAGRVGTGVEPLSGAVEKAYGEIVGGPDAAPAGGPHQHVARHQHLQRGGDPVADVRPAPRLGRGAGHRELRAGRSRGRGQGLRRGSHGPLRLSTPAGSAGGSGLLDAPASVRVRRSPGRECERSCAPAR